MEKSLLIWVIVVAAIAIFFGVLIMNMIKLDFSPSPLIIKKSVPMGDYVIDNRTAEDVCGSMLIQIEQDNFERNCNITSQEIVQNYTEYGEKCVDGASVAGCFACEFECS